MTDEIGGELSPHPLHDDSKRILNLLNNILEQKSWGRQYSIISLTPDQTESFEPDVIITLHTAGLSQNIGPLQSVYHTGNLGTRAQEQFIYDGYLQALQTATVDPQLNNEFRMHTTASLRQETQQRLEGQNLPPIIITFGQSTLGITGMHLFFSKQYLPQDALDILKTYITSESLLPILPPNTPPDIPKGTLQ